MVSGSLQILWSIWEGQSLSYVRLIWEMMKVLGQRGPSTPRAMDQKTIDLRISLIEEECVQELLPVLRSLTPEDGPESDKFVKVVDGLCDTLVVVYGTLIAMGVPIEEVMNEVCENNLAKFAEKIALNDLGKGLKPEGHKPPDLESILRSREVSLNHLMRVVALQDFEEGEPIYVERTLPGEFALGRAPLGKQMEWTRDIVQCAQRLMETLQHET